MQHKNPEYFERIENFIDDYRANYGSSPTVREIARGTKLSDATTCRYLQDMRENGLVEYEGHRNLITKRQKKTLVETVEVPVLGSISCGVPKFAEENIEEYIRLPVSLFGRGDFYLLRANGESMIEVGIDDGDLVLIRQQNYADNGDIVVALMDDEATLKRFYPEPKKRRIRLHPENSEMKDIYVENCIIQGVAVKVIKDLA
jgi:repressor LexA